MQFAADGRPKKALDGIRVVDFTRNIAGAYITRLMGDLGADVMKVEAPHQGDTVRYMPPANYAEHKVGGFFIQMNCSKRGLSLDLKRPEAQEIVYELVKVSDVVTNNFVPGTMERMGLGYETLAKINPSIIMCSVSGYGQYGPYRDRPAAEYVIEASTGNVDMTGEPDRPPQFLGQSFCDTTTALTAFGSIMAALYCRAWTGIGQHLDVAMHDSSVACNDLAINRYVQTEGEFKPHRYGRFFYHSALTGAFRCGDGSWIVISGGSGDSFERLCNVIGRPDLAEPEAFGKRESRWDPEKTPELYRAMEEWTLGMPSAAEAERFLLERRVMARRVRTIEEVVHEENTKVRGLLSTIHLPELGEVTVQNTALKFSETPAAIQRIPPRIGEHTREVLEGLLGYEPRRIANLFVDEVVWAEPQFQEEILRAL